MQQAGDEANPVELNIAATILDHDLSSRFLSEDERLSRLKSCSDGEKLEISRHLSLRASGSLRPIHVLGSLVNDTSVMVGGVDVTKVPTERWSDRSKSPYASIISSTQGKYSLPIEIATVDDLRTLLIAAEENGVQFASGAKQKVIDKAMQIMQDLGLAR